MIENKIRRLSINRVLCGDTRELLKEFPDESIHCCITSPPYWSLRDYQTEPLIWDAGNEDCEHEWGNESRISMEYVQGNPEFARPHREYKSFKNSSQFCRLCGCWRGSLGLEPTPELYVQHIVQIFREVKRVLRNDGTFWLNIGDSYWGGKGQSGQAWATAHTDRDTLQKSQHQLTGMYETRPQDGKHSILKPKDLCGIPWRVAFALQADGWYLRSDIIWVKCLSGGTRVYAKTQKGEMPMTIRELSRLRPETVKLWSGTKWVQLREIEETFPKETVEFRLRSGESLSCTTDHKWPTKSGLKRADEICIGDVIEDSLLPEPANPHLPDGIPDNIGFFIGLFLAEGSWGKKGSVIQFSLNKSENELTKAIKKVAKYYGECCTVHDYGNSRHVNIHSKIITGIIKTYIVGKGSKRKHLSTATWQRSGNFLWNLLMGYLKGDGHLVKEGFWKLGFTSNEALMNDLRTLASRTNTSIRLKWNWAIETTTNKRHKMIRGDIRINPQERRTNDKQVVAIQKSKGRRFFHVGVDKPHIFVLASGVLTHNSNPMPESVRDRPTRAHEYVFLLTKSRKYYYDADAIKEPAVQNRWGGHKPMNLNNTKDTENQFKGLSRERDMMPETRNKRTIWTIPTQSYKGAHFATFPEALVRPMILAGTSEKGCCPECGAPWVRIIKKCETDRTQKNPDGWDTGLGAHGTIHRDGREKGMPGKSVMEQVTIGWRPSCKHYDELYKTEFPKACKERKRYQRDVWGNWWKRVRKQPGKNHWDATSCTVLDPFSGSGTVGVVCKFMRRNYALIDLSLEYCKMAENRIKEASLSGRKYTKAAKTKIKGFFD